MIVSQLEHRLVVVFQRDHAALSGELARRWRRPAGFDEPLWERFVDATAHHDDGWREEEGDPVLGRDGLPLEFRKLPSARHAAVWRRSVGRGAARDPYIGRLIAGHVLWLNANVGSELDAEDARLCEELEARARELTEMLASSACATERRASRQEHLEAARRLLTFFDGLSLTILGALEPGEFPEPLRWGKEERRITLHRSEAAGPDFTIDPWPFGQDEIAVTVRRRVVHLPRRAAGAMPFPSVEALVAALQSAEPEYGRYRLTPA